MTTKEIAFEITECTDEEFVEIFAYLHKMRVVGKTDKDGTEINEIEDLNRKDVMKITPKDFNWIGEAVEQIIELSEDAWWRSQSTVETTHLCSKCIAAIKSRGEKVFVGSEVEPEEPDQTLKCVWCEENDVLVYECVW